MANQVPNENDQLSNCYIASLLINETKMEDEINYVLVVENREGRIEHSVKLNVCVRDYRTNSSPSFIGFRRFLVKPKIFGFYSDSILKSSFQNFLIFKNAFHLPIFKWLILFDCLYRSLRLYRY